MSCNFRVALTLNNGERSSNVLLEISIVLRAQEFVAVLVSAL